MMILPVDCRVLLASAMFVETSARVSPHHEAEPLPFLRNAYLPVPLA